MSRFMWGRANAAGLLALGLALSVSACGAGDGATSGASGSGGAAAGTAGIVEFDTTSAIDAQFVVGARSALEKAGWEVLSQDPKGDPGQANTICTQYVTRQVKAIVVTTFALDQMSQCMSQAKAANIPVFYIGSPLLDGMAGAVDVTSPKPINDLFVTYVKDQQVTDVLTLDYTPGTPCRIRKEYRDEQLKGTSVKVSKHEFPIPGQVVDAQNATAAWLAAHPAGSGKLAIWSCFTDPSAGAVAAIKQAGRSDIPIYTWDFNKTILEPLKSGEIAATLSLDGTKVGAQVAGLVKDYLSTKQAKGVPAENTILTKDNIDQFLKDHPNFLN
ncbi:sugar ABC transporter substrate-binding protein [Phycicoccus duodecadis]|uniref:ABC-type sugar transport system substrate-binding protein n=1 Tax=Phycicoccus duodecadis TaxID=173053 RepID=A0A2N3YGK1_9MICO|nr:substrate-binding domain-containing protein [Phycicoccus duodecadis]PKW25982.1 ABC-type sugar transport system substrate-binding protein [Phycicoccus duodecadis]